MTDAALNGLGNWQFLTASNITRRVIGEGQRVPAPQVVGAAGSGTSYLGGLMVLQFGPISYVPPSQTTVSNLSVYGNDFEQIIGAPVNNALRYDYQYYVTSPSNASITLQLPSGASTDPNNPNRSYRVSFSAYIQVGTKVVRRDYTELQPVLVNGQPLDPTGQYPLVPVPLATLVAPDTIVSVDLNTLNVQRYFRQLVKDTSQPFSQTDPYEYKLLNENLGVLLFNPLGNGVTISRQGHDREALTARVNYDVYDWRILHDDFRIDNGVLPGVVDAANPQLLTAEHKLPVGALKVAGLSGVDGLPITAIPPLELKTNDGSTDTSAANSKGADNFVLMDMATGGVYFESQPTDPAVPLITVNKSTGVVTITSDPQGTTGGISEWLLLPDGSQANVQMDNRAVRALYMTKQEYSVQVLKASSQYSAAPSPLNLTTGQFFIGQSDGINGNPGEIYFPQSDNGRKVTVGEVAYTSSADGFIHHLFAQDFLIQNHSNDPLGPSIRLIDVDGTANGIDFTNGFGARGIKGASVAVRVLWNPHRLHAHLELGHEPAKAQQLGTKLSPVYQRDLLAKGGQQQMIRIPRRAFTLIELLTVIAITAVLMTIIVLPVYQSFNLTRSAQAFADAQARARIVADKISREIGNATAVRNTNVLVSTTLNGQNTQVAANSVIIVVPKLGSTTNPTAGNIEVVLPYVKLDLIPPAEGTPAGPGTFTNPTNGFIDPTMQSPKGQPTLPGGPGMSLIRYFPGLHDPTLAYNNPYDGILMARTGGRDNLFVLYRAEVTPLVYRKGQGSNGDTTFAYRPNLSFFQSDLVTDKVIIDIDDPRFFLNDNAPNVGNTNPGQTKLDRIQAWEKVATRETDLSRYDMIQPVYDKASHVVTYSGDAPQIVPLIQFRPGHVDNDQAQGQVALRSGEETNNGATVGPDVFRTRYGLWSNQVARVWPQGWNPAQAANDQYFVGRNDPSNGTPGAPPGYSVYYYDPAVSPTDYNSGTEVFDIYTYEFVAASQGRFPFSQAVSAADGRSNWTNNQTIRDRFVPFDMNSAKGKVISSFGIGEVGQPNIVQDPLNPLHLPMVITNDPNTGPFAAGQGPNLTGTFDGYPYINDKFNKIWQDYPDQQATLDRFIDLRVETAAYHAQLHSIICRARLTPGSVMPSRESCLGARSSTVPTRCPEPTKGRSFDMSE